MQSVVLVGDEVAPAGEAEPAVALAPAVESRASRRTLWALAFAALAIVGGSLLAARVVGQPAATVYRFTIPAGTAQRVKAGEQVDVVPASLVFQLRDRLVVRNDDVAEHQIGPLRVAPGETLDRRFSEVVSFSQVCSLHPSGNVTISVRPRS